MSQPLTPFDLLFAQLTQGMTARAGSKATPITNEVGTFADAMQTQADRLVWITKKIAIKDRPFCLPQDVSQNDQAVTFDVAIYGSSLLRVLDMHGWLAGILDLLIGPMPGCAPSTDHVGAVLTGDVDLMSLSYPYDGLDGLSLAFLAPALRSVTFAGSYGSPVEIAAAVNVLARAQRLGVLASLVRSDDAAQAFLCLTSPQDPLDPRAHAMTLDPDAAGSACGVLGFASSSHNVTASTTPASTPYRPGYAIGEGQPGPRGGDLASSSWGIVVPIELRRPSVSTAYRLGMILTTPSTVETDDEIVVDNPGAI